MARSNAAEDRDRRLVIDRLRAEVAELQQSRRRLVEAESADRRELERALHDGLQQRLVALAADIQYLARQLDQDPASAKGLVDAMSESLRESLAEATALAEQLYPPLLDGRGLATSLRSAAAVAGVALVVTRRRSRQRSTGRAPRRWQRRHPDPGSGSGWATWTVG